LVPLGKSSKKKETMDIVDIRKWNGEGIPYSILLRNLQQFSHLIESDKSKTFIYDEMIMNVQSIDREEATPLGAKEP
jgi:hypothetical protein